MNFEAAQNIALHCYITLARANGKIDAKIKAARTLRDGQELQEIEVDKESLDVIDN